MKPNPDESAGMEFRHPEIEKLLRDIGTSIDKQARPHGYGFTLILAQLGKGGGTFYISNVERESMLNMLTEMLIRFQQEEEEK